MKIRAIVPSRNCLQHHAMSRSQPKTAIYSQHVSGALHVAGRRGPLFFKGSLKVEPGGLSCGKQHAPCVPTTGYRREGHGMMVMVMMIARI